MRIRKNETGASRLKVLFVLALLGVAFYVGIKILAVEMTYERMKDTMETKAGVAQVLKDQEILEDLVAKAKELDLPLTADSFIIIRDEDSRKMTIKTSWDEEVHFFGNFYVYTFHFAPVVEENIMSM